MSGFGLPFCPDVPDVLGVPSVSRIPSAIFGQLTSSLGGASAAMTEASLTALISPAGPQSTIFNAVNSASNLLVNAHALLGGYSSTLFNQYGPQVSNLSTMVGGILSGIQQTPTAQMAAIQDTLTSTSAQLDNTFSNFSADLGTETTSPTLSTSSTVSESITVTATRNSSDWGIFDSGGNSVIQGGSNSNFVSLEYRSDFVVADYPIEQGGFESYDKVALPFDVRVTVSCGGPVDDRQTFLDSIQAIKGDTNLYSVGLPEGSLSNMNVTHVDFARKSDNGLGLLIVQIYLVEIRQTAEVSFVSTGQAATPASATNVAAPSAAATLNGGTVQSVIASSSQQSAAFLNLNQLSAPLPLFQ